MKRKILQYIVFSVALFTFSLTLYQNDSVARLVSGVLAHNHSSTAAGGITINLGGSLDSTKPCTATGYTRVTPNYCEADAQITSFALAGISNPCTLTTAIPGLTDAKAVVLQIDLLVSTLNTIGIKSTSVDMYREDDLTCTTILQEYLIIAREFVAVLAGSNLAFTSLSATIKSDINGRFRVLTTGEHANDFVRGFAIGYFD